jgi:glycosyltransferase involved in cell wall biosynthesis
MSTIKLLFAKFSGEEILLEQGRLLFSLLNAFSSEGYQIRLFDNLPVDRLGKYAQPVFSLKNLTVSGTLPKDTQDWIYLFDREDRKFGKQAWYRKIMVRYDVFSPYWFRKPVIMPFPVHPLHNTPDLDKRLQQYRSARKNMKIFFSGDTKGYSKNRIQYPKAKLPRLEAINTILERMDDDVLLVKEPSELSNLRNAVYINKCVIVDTNEIWVDSRDWLGDLARADFFLSPPGIVMPMCHNLIEAMAVGTIPVTNYPEWFDPDLRHMETCIVFDGKDDLINKLQQAMNMNETQLEKMRMNVLDYYETHLKPEVFIQRLESSNARTVPLLIFTERNVARNFSKLNRNSILIPGTTFAGEGEWIRHIPQRLLQRQLRQEPEPPTGKQHLEP